MTRFEVWQSADGLFHWLRRTDGKVTFPQNSYAKRMACNEAIEKQRRLYPDAEIVFLGNETPKGLP